MTKLRDLLFLAHRIPYPPDKGDKIRSWNILSYLSKRYTVHLGCFVDDRADLSHVYHLKQICGDTYFARIRRPLAGVWSLGGFLSGAPLTLPYYRDKGLSDWIHAVVARHGIGCCYVFSSAMAQYVMTPMNVPMRRVMDFVDVDSRKWQAYGARMPWPRNILYQREGRKLLQYERLVAEAFDACLFVSAVEANEFISLAPEFRNKLYTVANGVDVDYFSPDHPYESPYPGIGPVLVFTGAMDYWPNAEAASWFARDVLPLIRQAVPQARFYIVGRSPTLEVRRLDRLPGVLVTGPVADVRPYLAHAAVALAPLRLAWGTQNKVLEAMAMGRPVIASPEALKGLNVEIGVDVLCAQDPLEFVDKVVSVVSSPNAQSLGDRARARVLASYRWADNLESMTEIIGGS